MLKTSNPTRPDGIEDLLTPDLIAKIGRLDVSSRKVFAGKLKGERRSKKRGQSVEFADHRPYVIGDDIRHIDWNIFGRLDRLFLKMFLEEEDLGLHVVLDGSASSDSGEPATANKFFFMQRAAMALGYVGLVNLNRVACTVMGGIPVEEVPPETDVPTAGATPPPVSTVTHVLRDLRGRRRTMDLARFLCSLAPGGSFSFRKAAERIALTRRGKGVMLVFSDFLFKEGYEDGLRLLLGHGYDLYCVQVLAPQELEPGLAGDLSLIDIEDGDSADVTIAAPLLKKYKALVAAYCERLREFCGRRDITHMVIRSDTPVDSLLLDYLRKRGALR